MSSSAKLSKKNTIRLNDSPIQYAPNGDYSIFLAIFIFGILIMFGFTQDGTELLAGVCLLEDICTTSVMIVNGSAHELVTQSPATIFAELYPWYPNALWSNFI